MTRTEHLERIKKKCEFCLQNCKDNGIDKWTDPSMAGWKSTIAAIDGIQGAQEALLKHNWDACELNPAIDSIISAWPEELI